MARTGALLCPSCRKLISADERKCPYCGALHPGMFGLAPALQRLFGARMDLVPALIGACAVLYALSLLLDLGAVASVRGPFSFLAPSSAALFQLGMTGGIAHAAGRWWTTLTAIYLHADLLHIVFNMMWIRQLAPDAQEIFGRARFFVLFTVTGVAGFVLSNFLGAHPSVGASGAIFGIMGAMLAYGRRDRSTWGEMMSRQMLQWAVILLLFGFLGRGVNNWAHLGGLASGFLLGQRLPAQRERREGRGTQLLALALAICTLAGFVMSLLRPLVPSMLF